MFKINKNIKEETKHINTEKKNKHSFKGPNRGFKIWKETVTEIQNSTDRLSSKFYVAE